MMIQAVLGNPHHPEYGVATIPFPIPRDQHAHCMELLEALEIGDAVKADCKVEKIDSFYTVLKRTEMLTVNVGWGMGWSPPHILGDHGYSAPPETSSFTLLPFLNLLHVGFETGPVPVPAYKTVSGMRTALTPLTAATYRRLSLLPWRSGRKKRRAAPIGFVFHLVVPPTKKAASNDRHRLHALFHCLRLLRKLRQQALDLLHDGLDLFLPSDG